MGMKRLTDVKIEQDGERPDSSSGSSDQTPSFGNATGGVIFLVLVPSPALISAEQSAMFEESARKILLKMFDPRATNENHHLPEANVDFESEIK
jgi:hypothetical protein